MLFDEKTLKLFNNSLERCQADPHFLTLFYRKFVISNEEVRRKFANTDMDKQKMMLHASLYMIMLSAQNNEAASLYLERIAKRHSKKELDIKPELYDLWLATLIETVKETDSDFNEEIEIAWNKVITYGVNYLKERHYK